MGRGTLREVEEHWTYRDLLTMIYLDDIEIINNYNNAKNQEMED